MYHELLLIKDKIQDLFVNVPIDSLYKINHVILGESEGLYSDYVPCCAIIPEPSYVSDQYIGQDTDTENILIRFYVAGAHGDLSDIDVSTGLLKLVSMCEMLKYAIRLDPTFNGQMVACTIESINYGTNSDTNYCRMAEVKLKCLSRRLWNPDGDFIKN